MASQDTRPADRYDYRAITSTLKRVLKRKKVTYKQLATRMGMSESGIKKLMAADDGSFARLSELCEAADIDLFAVLELAWKAPPKPFIFSAAQDAWFAKNRGYYYFFIELHSSKGDTDKVAKRYSLDAASVQRYVNKLEELGLCHELPGGRVRFAPEVTDRMRNGPKMRAAFGPDVQHKLVDDVYKRSVAKKSPVFPGTMFVTAHLRMTRERLVDMNRALHEVVLRYGTDAVQDELGAPERSLIDTGVLVVSAEADVPSYYDIPRLPRRGRKR